MIFWLSSLKKKNTSGVSVASYDLCKAFDKVSFNNLVKYLLTTSLPHGFISWYMDSLSNQNFVMKYNSLHSSPVQVLSGIPQGSVLSPIMFSCYMSQIICTKSFQLTYADDITCVVVHKQGNNHTLEFIEAMIEMEEQIAKVNLSINKKKCQFLKLSKSSSFNISDEFLTANDYSNFTDTICILGVTFNAKLSWNQHFDNIHLKANKRIFLLRHLRPFFNSTNLATIYFSVIRSILEYCNVVFTGATFADQSKLNSVQCRAHNAICGWQCNCSIFPNLSSHRQEQAIKLFLQAASNQQHPLYNLIPEWLKNSSRFKQPYASTTRRHKSFVNICTVWANDKYL